MIQDYNIWRSRKKKIYLIPHDYFISEIADNYIEIVCFSTTQKMTKKSLLAYKDQSLEGIILCIFLQP
jgi:hypothetical protein